MAAISAVCCLVVLPILLTVYVLLFCLYLLANKVMIMMMVMMFPDFAFVKLYPIGLNGIKQERPGTAAKTGTKLRVRVRTGTPVLLAIIWLSLQH